MESYKKTLAGWASGTAHGDAGGTGARVVVTAVPGQVEALRAAGLVGEGTTVYTPDGQEGTWGYDGSLEEPYGEVLVAGEFSLQVVPYALGRYIPVGGPTLLRVTETSDLEAYLSDADEAFTTGRFPGLVAGPTTLLADEPALGGWTGRGGPGDRLWVRADGEVSTSPWGAPLGTAEDPLDALVVRWAAANDAGTPCAVALSRAVSDDERAAAFTERPWLGQYVKTLGVLRALAARGVDSARASGFGGRLDGALDGVPAGPGAPAPVLCWDAHHAYLSDAGRTVQIAHPLAVTVERILVLGHGAADLLGAAELDRVATYFADAGFPLLPAACAAGLPVAG
ncbi:daptide biosynthesis RiPP recognition protein [Georgenia faecalis]|uniref:daptide biosynthesis RiPP recognition protein n=1 Tax=Georgenia faecalis TaxID=2483799 RepID=UPI000FD8F208|nr:daptide biosynthesis RiPP recognition protein [Georgenia faecalis]